MSNNYLVALFFALCAISVSEAESIVATKEVLDAWEVGKAPLNLKFESDEEGFWSPQGPIIDALGRLYFVPTYSFQNLLQYSNRSLTFVDVPPNWSSVRRGVATYKFSNQQGQTINGLSVFAFGAGKVTETNFFPVLSGLEELTTTLPGIYPTSWGYIVEFADKGRSYLVASISGGKNELIDPNEAPKWLSQRETVLAINAEGHLTFGGIDYSTVAPISVSFERYLGRLSSGHGVFSTRAGGSSDQVVYITNSKGEVELRLELPWANSYSQTEVGSRFTYSIGTWGELYFLLAPPAKVSSGFYSANTNYRAELVVVRNHLRFFGRLNDGGVRLRKGPSMSTDILGTYPAKMGFRILEKGTKEETIGGQKNVWYKIRLLDGTEGWFFGSFVQNLYDGPNGNPPPWPNVADW